MERLCPYCRNEVKASWHSRYGIEKLERGVEELGIPVVGSVKVRRQVLVMVYMCEKANLPFLMVLPDAR
jgi:hypothetical protein